MDDEPSLETLRIGTVAARAGVNIPTLRYYERRGLIDAERRFSGQRIYRPDVVQLVRAIKIAQGLGFTLAEIEQIVRGADRGDAGERLRHLATRKITELDERIEELRRSRASLHALVEESCTSLTDCACPPSCPVSPDHLATEVHA